MKRDWKKIAASEGYKSLKAAYVKDVQNAQKDVRRGRNPLRDKKVFREYFKDAIGLAMKYSDQWNIPIEDVLNHWESVRNYWWLNFYQKVHLKRYNPYL